MSATRRAVAPLLNIQIFVFIVLTIVVGAGFWVERATYSAEFEGPMVQIRAARVQSARALSLPYEVAVTRDQAQARNARSAITKAESALERIAAEHADTKGIKRSVKEATDALYSIREILSTIEAATPSTRLTNAFIELAMQREKLEKALDTLESTVQHSMVFHYDEKIQAFLFVWAAAMVVTLLTAVAARRRTQANETDEDQRRSKAIDGLTRVLRQALDEDEVQLSVLPSGRHFRVVSDAIAKVVNRMETLSQTNKEMARSDGFLQDLQEALSLADTEQAVLQTAVRAAGSTNLDKGLEIINIDSSNRSLRLTAPSRSAGEAVDGEADYEASEETRSQRWHDSIDDAIQRNPDADDDSICVTVIAQMSRNEAKALRFDELEALALATAVRLSATRRASRGADEALTDQLTGLANRREYLRRMEELDKANLPYTLVMADLDHFKDLNDRYGHDIGDRCLEIFADVLRDACRGSDLPCRLGGEEFVLVLPNVGVKAGLAVAMRVRAYLADAVQRGPATFTVSLGVAARPEHGSTAEAVLRAADGALYDAKEAGRDQVVPARMQTNLEAAR
ncbi:MAG: hypothetical protein CL927_02440 [Deltaproteobacteria bacterium]|nr:hypothetical protein [Deltaproteobacteria bacterium]HCH66068.1 hypothetical protein [Deltaproteobacteria bacterium]